ncbi:MAG: hypothetical protein RI979_1115 [Pseudomonadota bacterium]
MHYRRDIDGLRFFAVIPVLLHHAGLSLLPGGWLGVDIFFVISGYLITRMLIDDYERRARRILPALFLVLFISTILALLWLPPNALLKFGESLGTTGLFVSNLYFMTQSGYFSDHLLVRPLIHTWSLAVEEQFYIVYPVLLIFAAKVRVPLLPLLVVLAAGSLGFAFWAHQAYPEQVFYFPISRAWELLVGSIAALTRRTHTSSWRFGGDIGLILICYALMTGASEAHITTPFPGLPSFMACLGTVLVLYFGAGRLSGWILLSRLCVGVGLISYSAYLWHQPLLGFAAVRLLDPPSLTTNLALIALSLLLAWLTWLWVEEPFRRRRVAYFNTTRKVFLTSLGLILVLTGGLPSRVPANVVEASSAVFDNPWRRKCDANRTDKVPDGTDPACLLKGAGPTVYLYGDSHAGMLWGELMRALEDEGRAGYVSTKGGCVSLPGLADIQDMGQKSCNDFANGAMQHLSQLPDDTIVVLALRWNMYIEGVLSSEEIKAAKFNADYSDPLSDGVVFPLGWPDEGVDEASRKTAVLASMADTINQIAQRHKLILVYPVPEAGSNVPDRLARLGMYETMPEQLSWPAAIARDHASSVELMLDTLEGKDIVRIRPRSIFCNVEQCMLSDEGQSFYFDANHLSQFGSALVVDEILESLD